MPISLHHVTSSDSLFPRSFWHYWTPVESAVTLCGLLLSCPSISYCRCACDDFSNALLCSYQWRRAWIPAKGAAVNTSPVIIFKNDQGPTGRLVCVDVKMTAIITRPCTDGSLAHYAYHFACGYQCGEGNERKPVAAFRQVRAVGLLGVGVSAGCVNDAVFTRACRENHSCETGTESPL